MNKEARPCCCCDCLPLAKSCVGQLWQCVFMITWLYLTLTFVFFYKHSWDYLSNDIENILLHCVPSPQVTAPSVTRLFLIPLEKEGEWVPVSLPCPKKRAKPYHWLKGAIQRWREQGMGSLFICTRKRLQESTGLLSVSLKLHPSIVSQAPARQQTLTCIKTDNLEKNKRKSRVFTKMKIMVTLYNCQKLINRP